MCITEHLNDGVHSLLFSCSRWPHNAEEEPSSEGEDDDTEEGRVVVFYPTPRSSNYPLQSPSLTEGLSLFFFFFFYLSYYCSLFCVGVSRRELDLTQSEHLSHTHTHTHTLSLSLSLLLSHSLTLSFFLTLSFSHTLTLSHPLTLSLSHFITLSVLQSSNSCAAVYQRLYLYIQVCVSS